MGACRMPLLTLTVVVLILATAGGKLPVTAVGGHEHALADPTAERHKSVATGAGASAAGAVEDDKAYIVGRPLFKVPPSSPCRRAKSARC
ncbi:unnamed protein product [Miscanthus lutarioriparius]|uniref:Uncharacterized protein n=1 Tax=Miscanthus lutarioriparius TaxID=422564 RepID=A0A811PS75_9POAL|nr:unnamed protein product [Miscanthus lutarioriparius]